MTDFKWAILSNYVSMAHKTHPRSTPVYSKGEKPMLPLGHKSRDIFNVDLCLVGRTVLHTEDDFTLHAYKNITALTRQTLSQRKTDQAISCSKMALYCNEDSHADK